MILVKTTILASFLQKQIFSINYEIGESYASFLSLACLEARKGKLGNLLKTMILASFLQKRIFSINYEIGESNARGIKKCER